MTNPGLSNLMSRVHATLKRAGLADGGTQPGDGAVLRRKNGTQSSCRVFFRLNAEVVGPDGVVLVVPALITALRSDIGVTLPVSGDSFIIGAQAYKVDGIVPGEVTEAKVACRCLAGVPA